MCHISWQLSGSESITRLFFVSKANVNSQKIDGTTALLASIKRGNEDVATFLINNGADHTLIKTDGTTAINSARKESLNAIVTLIDSKDR